MSKAPIKIKITPKQRLIEQLENKIGTLRQCLRACTEFERRFFMFGELEATKEYLRLVKKIKESN